MKTKIFLDRVVWCKDAAGRVRIELPWDELSLEETVPDAASPGRGNIGDKWLPHDDTNLTGCNWFDICAHMDAHKHKSSGINVCEWKSSWPLRYLGVASALWLGAAPQMSQ